jgi:hypothetical protein
LEEISTFGEKIGPKESDKGQNVTTFSINLLKAGLPDFSWRNIPNRGKYVYQNDRKTYQMATTYSKYNNIACSKAIQNIQN